MVLYVIKKISIGKIGVNREISLTVNKAKALKSESLHPAISLFVSSRVAYLQRNGVLICASTTDKSFSNDLRYVSSKIGQTIEKFSDLPLQALNGPLEFLNSILIGTLKFFVYRIQDCRTSLRQTEKSQTIHLPDQSNDNYANRCSRLTETCWTAFQMEMNMLHTRCK